MNIYTLEEYKEIKSELFEKKEYNLIIKIAELMSKVYLLGTTDVLPTKHSQKAT